jgi:hypothetical protein
MEPKTIQDKIALYRNSQAEWVRRRQAALSQAEECLARANACHGAIEALESLLPAVPIEDVIHAIGGEVVDLPRKESGNASQ